MLIQDFASNYKDDPITFFRFNPEDLKDIDLYLGIKAMEHYKKTNNISVYLDFEAPNYSTKIDLRPNYYNFDYIVSICPYTVRYQNTLRNNHLSCYFPVQPFSLNHKKKYDVIYTGQMHSTKLEDLLSVITKFNYVNVSFTKSSIVTHKNISYVKKMKLVSQSNVSIIHNLVFPNYELSDYPQARVLGFTSKNNVYPQLKSRVFEAAICKSLMLVLKDDFNIIENYFTENVDFIYFSNRDELEFLIDDARNYPSKYESLVNNAYIKCLKSYTVDRFFTDFIYPLSSRIL